MNRPFSVSITAMIDGIIYRTRTNEVQNSQNHITKPDAYGGGMPR